jgi:hypothetical protein
VGQRPTLELSDDVIASVEALDQKLGGSSRLERLAAGEHVHCRIAIFRPGVDGEMGFRYGYYSGDALRLKLVEGLAHYGGAYRKGGFNESLADELKVV